MAKQRSVSPAAVLVRSVLASLGVYVGGVALLALLVVRGVVGEGSAFGVVAVLCGVAAMVSGLLCGRRLPWSALANGLCGAAGFGLVLALVCLCTWDGGPGTDGIILFGCVLLGGCAAGVLSGKRKKRVARRFKRR